MVAEIAAKSPIDEFRSSLRKGSGRAMILLRADPDNPEFQSALVHACKVNLVYDRQCEESREPYLRRLIERTGQAACYQSELLRTLNEPDYGDASHDPVQMYGVLCQLAAADAHFNRTILRQLVLDKFPDAVGLGAMYAFVELEGIDGFLMCLRRFYPSLCENIREDGWRFRSLRQVLIDRDGEGVTTAALEEARSKSTELDHLLSINEKEKDAPDQSDNVLDYAGMKSKLGADYGFPIAWARNASPEELLQVAKDLLEEQDEQKILRYLSVFSLRRRTFPLPANVLFPFVFSRNIRVAERAARILERIDDPEIRPVVFQLLFQSKMPDLASRLLRHNYVPGDLGILRSSWQEIPGDDEDWHRRALALLNLLRHADVSAHESRELLFSLYEQVPCSFCRSNVVDKLLQSEGLYQIPVNETHVGDSQVGANMIHHGKRDGVCHGGSDRASKGLRRGRFAAVGTAFGRCRSDASVVGVGFDL